ncbi:MAG: iron-siderophore ABC transporter substrate-binding protein [Goleter apudmare HA4340-LM2]|jgi:iron complex transport system substrate-binding protein|nr:iron-siderophore ABC transporter substrate-binding protein [Goleter apudmare HA4340-LM2]
MGVLRKAAPVKILQSRTIYLLLLGILIFSVVSACARNVNHTTQHSEQAASECRVVQHLAGETCVPNNPKRVVTIASMTLGNALILGIKPVASTSGQPEDLNSTYLSNQNYLGNRVSGVKNIGKTYMPSLEAIKLLNPDLILSWQYTRDIYPLLSQISPTILAPWQGPPSWRENFNFMAEALGKQEVAQQAWNHYYQRVEKLKIALGDQYRDKKISITAFSGEITAALVKNSFSGSILEDVGLHRPKAQDIVTDTSDIQNISEETLEEIDGDILFVLTYDSRDKSQFEAMQQKPLWKKLKAVQQGRAYPVNSSFWGGNNLLAADAVIDDLYKYLVNTP